MDRGEGPLSTKVAGKRERFWKEEILLSTSAALVEGRFFRRTESKVVVQVASDREN